MDEIREVKLWRSIAHGQFINLGVFRLVNYKDMRGGSKLEKVPFLSHHRVLYHYHTIKVLAKGPT